PALLPTSEAVKNFLDRIDMQRAGLLVVERAFEEPFLAFPPSLATDRLHFAEKVCRLPVACRGFRRLPGQPAASSGIVGEGLELFEQGDERLAQRQQQSI